jgi:hypothetical protein
MCQAHYLNSQPFSTLYIQQHWQDQYQRHDPYEYNEQYLLTPLCRFVLGFAYLIAKIPVYSNSIAADDAMLMGCNTCHFITSCAYFL